MEKQRKEAKQEGGKKGRIGRYVELSKDKHSKGK